MAGLCSSIVTIHQLKAVADSYRGAICVASEWGLDSPAICGRDLC